MTGAEPLYLVALFAALLGGILSGVPVMLVLLGVPLGVAGVGIAAGHFDPDFLRAFPQRLFGLANNALLVAVPLFVAMGLLLERSRAAERMLLVMARLLGGSRRGLALAVVAVAALVAASTGIIGATIVMLALISLPAMVRAGVPVPLASGLVCASGTLGQIIPPSIVLILLGDQVSNTYLEARHAVGDFAPEPVSVADLFAGALLPGLLLVTLYAGWAWWRLGGDASGNAASGATGDDDGGAAAAALDAAASLGVVPADDLAGPIGARTLLTVFLPPLLLIASVLGAILAGVATPTEAAAVGAGGALLLAAAGTGGESGDGTGEALRDRAVRIAAGAAALAALLLVARESLPSLRAAPAPGTAAAPDVVGLVVAAALVGGLVVAAYALARRGALAPVLLETATVTAMVFGIVAGASMLALVFRGFGGDEAVAALLKALPGEEAALLVVVMLVIFALGFVLEFVEIIFIVVPIVGPALFEAGVDPVWFAILVALNLQTSFLTPPFGFALFYFRSVAPDSLSTIGLYRAIVPFVALQGLALCSVYAFPALATWLPGLVD